MPNIINKESILLEWCKTNPFMAADMPLFNWLGDENEHSAIIPIAETVVEKYIDGSKSIHYDFMWAAIFSVSDSPDTTNTDSIFDLRKWQNWIDEQNESGNLPDFGIGYDMHEVQNLSGMPSLAQTYGNDVGKYQFPARLIYMQN